MRDFHFPGRSPVIASNGMAATSMPGATLAALDVLRAGGNALDAAVAAVAVLCVIEPMSTGIGGDCFCLYAPAGSKTVIALNGSGRAPAAADVEFFQKHQIGALENTSAHSVTVPGAVSAWETLLAAHGTKGLDEVLQAAIGFAEHGHPVSPKVHRSWVSLEGKLRKTGAHAFLPNGAAPGLGEMFVQPQLAATLKAIAKNGARAFYEGPVAADIVATLRTRGGLHTEADFAAGLHGAEFVDPISLEWQRKKVWQCPPNGQGLFVLMILGILENLGVAKDGPLGVTRLHRHIEAAKLAYRDRDAFLADPGQVSVPVDHLLDPGYLRELSRLIRDDRAMAHMPAAGEAAMPVHRDTVYLCVVDKDGNACSFINSLFQGFGSGILAEKSGVMLQNRGFGFVLDPEHPNCIAPNKRPMHTIIPGMLTETDGEAIMPFGVMGGHFQPMGQSMLLTNHYDYGLDIQESLDLPRLFPYEGKVQVERGIPAEVVKGLRKLGHEIADQDEPHGVGRRSSSTGSGGCWSAGRSRGRMGLRSGIEAGTFSMTEACDLSAIAARSLIGQRKLSPVELLESCLARIDAVNPAVNAVVARDDAAARASAREAEAMVMRGDPLPALHGLPIGIKDLEEAAGLPTTWGSPIFKDHVSTTDDGIVASVRAAGAVIIGKTNTPEWGAGANTRNRVYGATGNPFDPTKSAAGSSGGSGVALATGMAPICTGSDTGGSLRNPAAFNGVVGFRPSPGLVPGTKRGLGWSPLPVVGPMARTAADAALLLSTMVSDDARDPLAYSVHEAEVRSAEEFYPVLPLDVSSLRVALTADFGFAPTEKHIAEVFAEKTGLFRSVFGRAEDATPDCAGCDEAFEILRATAFLAGHLERVRTRPEDVGPNIIANVEEGLRYSAADVSRAMVLQTQMYRRWQVFFDDYDVILTPAITISPRAWSELYPAEIDGRATRTYYHWLAMAYAATVVGHPAISIPVGLDRLGMPFGLQIVGPRGGDALVMRVAVALEALLAGDPRLARPVPDIAALTAAKPISSMPGFLGFG